MMKYLSKLLIVVAVITLFVLAMPLTAQSVVPANKTIVTKYLDFVYNKMDLDSATALMADNVVFHDPVWDSHDIKGFVKNYQLLYDRVHNLQITPYAVIGEGDFVVVPYVWEGSKAPTEPRAAYEPLSGNAVEFFRVLDGKIAEIWRQYEQHTFSILGTSEDYRSMAPIPMSADMFFMNETPVTEPHEVNADRRVILSWIDNYNRGKLDTTQMQPNFLYHTCPCADVGTVDLMTFSKNFRQMTAAGDLKPMTPVSHNLGFMMVSEGNLTAVLYDMHEPMMSNHPDAVSIFRLENGKIADLWAF